VTSDSTLTIRSAVQPVDSVGVVRHRRIQKKMLNLGDPSLRLNQEAVLQPCWNVMSDAVDLQCAEGRSGGAGVVTGRAELARLAWAAGGAAYSCRSSRCHLRMSAAETCGARCGAHTVRASHCERGSAASFFFLLLLQLIHASSSTSPRLTKHTQHTNRVTNRYQGRTIRHSARGRVLHQRTATRRMDALDETLCLAAAGVSPSALLAGLHLA
jgi:hypothetical protein